MLAMEVTQAEDVPVEATVRTVPAARWLVFDLPGTIPNVDVVAGWDDIIEWLRANDRSVPPLAYVQRYDETVHVVRVAHVLSGNGRATDTSGSATCMRSATGVRLGSKTDRTVAQLYEVLGLVGRCRCRSSAIGLMIAAGMSVGTLFTLFVLPTFYLAMGGRRIRAEAPPALRS
jgi:hypothetical protein